MIPRSPVSRAERGAHPTPLRGTGALQAIFRRAPPVAPHGIFTEYDAALAWAQKRLRQATARFASTGFIHVPGDEI